MWHRHLIAQIAKSRSCCIDALLISLLEIFRLSDQQRRLLLPLRTKFAAAWRTMTLASNWVVMRKPPSHDSWIFSWSCWFRVSLYWAESSRWRPSRPLPSIHKRYVDAVSADTGSDQWSHRQEKLCGRPVLLAYGLQLTTGDWRSLCWPVRI